MFVSFIFRAATAELALKRKLQDLLEQGSPAFETAMPILSQRLKAEMAEREVRSVAYHAKAAVRRANMYRPSGICSG